MLITEQYLFFYSTTEVYSNWYPCRFRYDKITFANSEQAMMYAKAKLMKDEDSMAKIKKESDPFKVKRLGRNITPWKEALWVSKRLEIVSDICYEKFKSNSELRETLLNTNNLHLVEAASNDKIWGVGMDEDNPKILNRKNWNGLNLLGEALMNARKKLVAEQ
jgi:ribA/ribD-fused uncharacterized protein